MSRRADLWTIEEAKLLCELMGEERLGANSLYLWLAKAFDHYSAYAGPTNDDEESDVIVGFLRRFVEGKHFVWREDSDGEVTVWDREDAYCQHYERCTVVGDTSLTCWIRVVVAILQAEAKG